jgi:hypothetical protein
MENQIIEIINSIILECNTLSKEISILVAKSRNVDNKQSQMLKKIALEKLDRYLYLRNLLQ